MAATYMMGRTAEELEQYRLSSTQHPLEGATLSQQFVDNGRLQTLFIARASYCSCDDPVCLVSPVQPHLVILYVQVPIKHARGAAVSYTWGEFERRQLTIGHTTSFCPVSVELGREWHIGDLLRCLVELSEMHDGVWMDQLCMPQGQAVIKATLASIPDIYRNLHVIVVMPGAVCNCLETITNRALELHDAGSSYGDILSVYRSLRCLNWIGFSSWFNRIWTWQEFLYSQHVTLLRTSRTMARCVTSEEDVQHLQPFSHLFYRRSKDAGSPVQQAMKELIDAQFMCFENALHLMTAYCGHANPLCARQESAIAMLSRFLRGDNMQNPQRTYRRDPAYKGEEGYAKLASFLFNLSVLATSVRKATQPTDYVIAVWVDCPGYEIPRDYRKMGVPDLLENAILQLESSPFSFSPSTTAPCGLFGGKQAGGLWRPTTYLRDRTIRDVREIYGVVAKSEFLSVYRQSTLLESLSHLSKPSMSSQASPYGSVLGTCNGTELLVKFHRVFLQFSFEAMGRVFRDNVADYHYLHRPPWLLDEAAFRHFMTMTEDEIAGHIPPLSSYETLPSSAYENIVYRVITSALGLPFDVCKLHGLEIMVSVDDRPSIGLFKPCVAQNSKAGILGLYSRIYGYVRRSLQGPSQYTTVCTSVGHREGHVGQRSGCHMLEAAYHQLGPPAILEVVGIWVPGQQTRDEVAWLTDRGRGVADGRLGGPFG